jgi:hypothetical protein
MGRQMPDLEERRGYTTRIPCHRGPLSPCILEGSADMAYYCYNTMDDLIGIAQKLDSRFLAKIFF